MAVLLPLAFPLPAHGGDGGYRLLELDGYKVKWGEQELGAGASVSYALADETLRFDDARNCRDLAPMRALSGQELSVETLTRETAAAFRVWERAAGLSFHRVDDVRDADIVLGAQGRPRGRAFANVSYASDPAEGVRPIEQALVCLNPDHEWKVGFDGNKDVYDIRYTLIHEIGHAIGLDHPGASGQVMGFRYTESFAELQPGDLDGVRRLYGPGVDDDTPGSGFETYLSSNPTGADHGNDLVGNAVANTADDEEIGAINELIIDQDGSILALVVGGFLAIGDNGVALPWERVQLTRDTPGGEMVVRVNADADRVDNVAQ